MQACNRPGAAVLVASTDVVRRQAEMRSRTSSATILDAPFRTDGGLQICVNYGYWAVVNGLVRRFAGNVRCQ